MSAVQIWCILDPAWTKQTCFYLPDNVPTPGWEDVFKCFILAVRCQLKTFMKEGEQKDCDLKQQNVTFFHLKIKVTKSIWLCSWIEEEECTKYQCLSSHWTVFLSGFMPVLPLFLFLALFVNVSYPQSQCKTALRQAGCPLFSWCVLIPL